ncbi:MAG: membrane protein insertase YidC, partial [Betaproteobacteria bacterium]
MDIQRTILLVIFGMSMMFLWDAWQKHQGRPSMFTPPVVAEQKAGTPPPATAPAKAAGPGEVPAAPAAAAAPAPAAGVPAVVAPA